MYKELICRGCGIFMDYEELVDGKCSNCDSDESVFTNDLSEEG